MGDNTNTSLMVRGHVIQLISESQLLDVFARYAPVKDIRLVKNKQTNE